MCSPRVRLFVLTAVLLGAAVLIGPAVPLCAQGESEAPGAAPVDAAVDAAVDAFVARELGSLVDIYRDFHQHPEISFREKETSRRLAEHLAAAGCQVVRNIGGYGLVGLIENGEGPTIMLRADLDALPVGEQTGLPYMSKIRTEDEQGRVAGIMHACGHDVHMTNLVAAAQFMGQNRGLWRGTMVFLGQPAEERSGGARAMLEDGLLDRIPMPDYAVALHVAHDLAFGKFGYRAGPAMANVDSVDITVLGRGGHGSMPQNTVDPVAQAAELVVALQTIVSREISPLDPAVVTVGSIHGGTKHNIISSRCDLQLTVRSYSDEVRAHLKEAIVRKAKAIAASYRAPEPVIEFSEGTPFVDNDPALTARLAQALRGALGDDNVVEVPPTMGAEDFARYGRAGIPSCMLRLGTIAPERLAAYAAKGEAPPSVHSPFYYPDPEGTLEGGVRGTVACLMALLGGR